jgi:hypothetical protein
MSKTQKRANWLKQNANAINTVLKSGELTFNSNNAARCKGWQPGYGWWANALGLANINCPSRPYWSGRLPTPSTAIPSSVAQFIRQNCPTELQ